MACRIPYPLVRAFGLLTLAATTAAAQDVPLGSRIRVLGTCPAIAGCDPVIGTLHQRQGDSLVVRTEDGSERRLLLGPRATLEVHRGRRGQTVQGLLVGSLAGLVAGAIDAKRCHKAPGEDLCDLSYAFGTLAGAGIGMLVGAVIKTDRWEAVPRATTVMAPGVRGVRLGVQLAI